MERYSKYLLLLSPFIFLLAIACGDEEQAIPFEIIQTSIEGTPVELRGEIKLSSADFDYRETAGWCEVTKEGNILKLQAGANYESFNRSTEIVIRAGSTEYRVPVTQSGILFEFLAEKITKLNYSLDGGERSVQLLTNVAYEAVIAEEDKDWIEVVKSSDGANTIIVKEGEDDRFGKVIFKYLEKEIEITINQFDYLGYYDLIGPATMTYTNSEGETVEIDVEILEHQEPILLLKGTFESGVEREIPLTVIDDDDHQGELRFYPGDMGPFTDPDVDERISSLCSTIFVEQYFKSTPPRRANDLLGLLASGQSYYYPAAFSVDEEGNHYTFLSNVGVPTSALYDRITRGIQIKGISANGRSHYGDPYDTIFDIKLFKP